MTGDTAAGVEKREIPIIWTDVPVGAIRELGNEHFVTFEEFLATIDPKEQHYWCMVQKYNVIPPHDENGNYPREDAVSVIARSRQNDADRNAQRRV